jgi:hypothetical protein
MVQNKKHIILSVSISFVYIFIGTYDNLTGLKIEKYLKSIICYNGDSFCELYMLIFYSQSYLYGALICGFFGSSDLAFIICQIFVWVFFFGIVYLIIMFLKLILSAIKNIGKKKNKILINKKSLRNL